MNHWKYMDIYQYINSWFENDKKIKLHEIVFVEISQYFVIMVSLIRVLLLLLLEILLLWFPIFWFPIIVGNPM